LLHGQETLPCHTATRQGHVENYKIITAEFEIINIYLSIYLSIYLFTYLSIYLFTYLFVCLFIYLFIILDYVYVHVLGGQGYC
jgi:hypothetical protein